MAKMLSIGGRNVGALAPTLIIAELSANHGQNLEKAIRTIRAAAEAGADAIKIQTYTPDTLTLKSDAPHFVVHTKNAWAGRTLHDLYGEAMTPWEWHAELQRIATDCGLLFFSTPFDVTAVELLEELAVPCHKVASFELTDLSLVEHVASRGKPIILSTGMASLGEIEAAVRTCRGVGNDQIALLRCVSAYPAEPASMHLRSLETLASFDTVIGLSDHTRDATVAIAAVALGARVVEKHFILNRGDGGPDSFFSVEPNEFRAMVDAIRTTEAAVGKPRFGPAPDELPSMVFRRSLIVARPVAAGTTLTCDDVRSVRPSVGLPPSYLPEVLGRTAARALAVGEPLTWDAVAGAASTPRAHLRDATESDAPLLLEWRNDKDAVAWSTSRAPVAEAEHIQWLRARLGVQERATLIAEDADRSPVGTVRLDPMEVPGSALVSIIVAPEARRRGIAQTMLRALDERARASSILRLVARIHPQNAASIGAFKRAGYYGFLHRRDGASGWIWCERRAVPFAAG